MKQVLLLVLLCLQRQSINSLTPSRRAVPFRTKHFQNTDIHPVELASTQHQQTTINFKTNRSRRINFYSSQLSNRTLHTSTQDTKMTSSTPFFAKFAAVLLLVLLALTVDSSNAKRSAPRKKAVPNMNNVPSSSFWKAKYGDYEISQEGFPFNFVMPAV